MSENFAATIARVAFFVAAGIVIGLLASSGRSQDKTAEAQDTAATIQRTVARLKRPLYSGGVMRSKSSAWPHGKLPVYPAAVVPHYIDCILQPKLIWNGKQVTCDELYAAEGEWTSSSDSMVINSTRCLGYLHASDVARNMLGVREIVLRRGSTDFRVFLQVFCQNNFAYVKDLSKFMPPDGRIAILDAGANVGLASLVLETATRFNGVVLAVDAVSPTSQVCRKNVAPSDGRITPIHAAIVAEPFALEHRTINVSGPKDQFWGFKVEHATEEYSDRVVEQVKTVTLKQLAKRMPKQKFDWIKLDIEGEEAKLFPDPGSREVLCLATCLFMELHEWMVPGCQAAFDEFMAWKCGGDDPFAHVTQTGEYTLLCKASAIAAATSSE